MIPGLTLARFLTARTAPSVAIRARAMTIMMSITKTPSPGTGDARQT